MRVLVTGGAGYIGSHACVELLEAGHEVFVIDNLINGHETALERVRDITKCELQFKNIDIVAERLGKDSNYSLDSSKLRKELSWDDLINLDSGIDRCIKWVTNNLSTLQKQSFKYVHKK